MSFLPSLLIFLAISQVHSININCSFNSTEYCSRSTFGCQVTSINITSLYDSTVNTINGEIHGKKNYTNVTCFSVENFEVNFFPHGLYDFFPNLNEIIINKAGLMQITKDDLKDFGFKLKTIKLGFNKISRVDLDLFKSNPNIEKIILEFNQISKVDSGAFDSLDNLHTLDFANNQCYDDQVYYDRNAVLRLIPRIYSRCRGNHKGSEENFEV